MERRLRSLASMILVSACRLQYSGEAHLMDGSSGLSGFGIRERHLICEEVKSLGSYGWMTLLYSTVIGTPRPS